MKLLEYISSSYLDSENIIQLYKYEQFIKEIQNNEYKYISVSEDFIECNIFNVLSVEKNKKILLSSVDIDFPPPKYPYKYDKYFDANILPTNYECIDYYEKTDTSIINTILENNLHVFSYSVSVNCPNITFIPLGIYSKFHHYHLKTNKKDNLCYLNIGIPCDRWFGNPRKQIINALNDKSFILKKKDLSMDQFYDDISRSKFAVSPRGCGIDTYRLWDCIVLGCIPIVEKYAGHEQWNDLPILFLDNIDDFALLTEDYLNKRYNEFLERDFKYEKCTINYWKNKILNIDL